MRGNLAHRKDKNHNEITNILTKLNVSFVDLHMVGNGCPDLLIGICNINFLVEIKDKKGVLTPKEIKFSEKWNGHLVVIKNFNELIDEMLKFSWHLKSIELIESISKIKKEYELTYYD